MDKNNKLPPSWVLSTLGNVCSQPQYGYTTKAATTGDLHLLRTTDITSGQIDWNTVPYCSENPQEPEKYLLKDGDVVISRAGSVGFSYLLESPKPAVFASYLIRFKPFIDRKFFKYFLQSPNYWKEISENKLGIAVPNVNANKLKIIPIPIPPLNEQKRIVAKIEELFTELDAGIASLHTAQAQLKTYRQSLLKHAFEGKLTAAWREEHEAELEPAAALLQRIQNERQTRYEEELQQWQKGGTANKRKPSPPKDLPPLTPDDLAALPQLPPTWAWLRLGNLNLTVSDGPFGSNLKTSDYVDHGVRVIRLENIGELKFIHDKESYISEEKYELLKNHMVTAGDIIFASFITEATRVIVLPSSIKKAVNKADCFLVRLHNDSVQSDFLATFLSTRLVFKQLEALIHGVGRPRINTTQLKEIAVPICGYAEQLQIVKEVKTGLSVIDQLEQSITTALQQAEALRQSILKKAFAGQLVPQDPHDEPASALLARIHTSQGNSRASLTKSL